MSSEKFCLRWNDFETNINEAFRELREQKDFFDVTLVCENEQVQAHKVILSACSSFFRNILRRNAHQHPLVYLKGVKFSDLQSVLNFMYQGEVSVAQEELNSFLAVAEDLRVKGLTQNQSENQKAQNQKPKTETFSNIKTVDQVPREPRLPTPRQQKSFQATPLVPSRFSSHATSNVPTEADDDDIQEVVPVKSEPRDLSVLPSAPPAQDIFTPAQPSHALTTAEDTLDYQEEEYGEYEQYQENQQYHQETNLQAKGCQFQDPSELLQFVRKDPDDNKFYCTLCDRFSHSVITCARNHVESQHYPDNFTYPCDLCDQILSSRNKFNNHKRLKHKKIKPLY